MSSRSPTSRSPAIWSCRNPNCGGWCSSSPATLIRAATSLRATEAMKLRLGFDGYAFATIDPVPQTDPETKEVSLTFVVEPKNRVYVRRINFNGTSGVNDEVFRREMRQLEGAYLSNAALERSKQRIQSRLPFIEKVEFETNPVAGTNDMVDVDFEIKEGLPGQFGGGVGYSESQSVVLNGNFTHTNFMGTGNRVQLELNSGRYSEVVCVLAHRSVHDDRWRAADDFASAIATSSSTRRRRPISIRRRSLPASVTTIRSPSISTSSIGVSAQQAELRHDELRQRAGGASIGCSNNGNRRDPMLYRVLLRRGWRCDFAMLTTSTSTARSSRPMSSTSAGASTRAIARFSRIAARAIVSMSAIRCPAAMSSSAVASYDYLQFVPIWRGFTLMFNLEAAYGKALGRHDRTATVSSVFCGGPESVRGFRESRLGSARTSYGRPYGGNIKTVRRQNCCCPCRRNGATVLDSACSSISAMCSPTRTSTSVGRRRARPSARECEPDRLRLQL